MEDADGDLDDCIRVVADGKLLTRELVGDRAARYLNEAPCRWTAGSQSAIRQLRRGSIGLWRNPGDDLEIATSEHRAKPTQTNTLTCALDMIRRLAIFQGLIRDEEAAGSNPATPTRSKATCDLRGWPPRLLCPYVPQSSG